MGLLGKIAKALDKVDDDGTCQNQFDWVGPATSMLKAAATAIDEYNHNVKYVADPNASGFDPGDAEYHQPLSYVMTPKLRQEKVEEIVTCIGDDYVRIDNAGDYCVISVNGYGKESLERLLERLNVKVY